VTPSSGSPPPLHQSPALSDLGRESTADSTPVSTPLGVGVHSKRSERERDLLFSWHKQLPNSGLYHNSSNFYDTELYDPDFGDSSFPLFPKSPPGKFADTMAGPASPIDITTPTRHASSSPSSRNQPTSNLTSALQAAGTSDSLQPGNIAVPGSSNGALGTDTGNRRNDSFSGGQSFGGQWGGGSRAIPVNNPNKEKPRRDSIASSLVGGMSWGGISVGSWIRDE
jgi:transcription factor SFP1